MSVHTNGAPAQVTTVLEIWQQTLNEAEITVDNALSTSAMMFGLVVMNVVPQAPSLAHALLEEVVCDIHNYIDANWEQASKMRPLSIPVRDADQPIPPIEPKQLRSMPPFLPQTEGEDLIQPTGGPPKSFLTPQDVRTIIEALGHLPHRRVADLIERLQPAVM